MTEKRPINLNKLSSLMWVLARERGDTLDQFNEKREKAEREVAEENPCLFKKIIDEK